MSTIIALGGGTEGLPILGRIRAAGHQLVVVDGNMYAPGFQLCHVAIYVSCYHPEQALPALQAWADGTGEHPDAVLCCAIDAPHVAAAVAARFGLPGLTVEQAALSCDKLAQKRALRDAGIDVPEFRNSLPLMPWYPPMSGVVVKPVDNRGARGVEMVIDPFELPAALERAKAVSLTGRAMFESYATGPQFSTESIVQDGRVLWTGISLRNYDRLEEYAPHIIEDGFDAPYGAALRGEIDALIESACRALDWYQQGGGIVKGDLVLHEGQLYIIELAARLSGGFLSTHGWPLAYGMPFVDYAIEIALGHAVYVAESGARQQFVSQRYLFPRPEWIGCKVKEINPAFYPEGCEFSTLAIAPGHVIRTVTDHAARLGQCIAVGATPEQAQERANAAVEAMREAITVE